MVGEGGGGGVFIAQIGPKCKKKGEITNISFKIFKILILSPLLGLETTVSSHTLSDTM